ncbi:ZP domain-containing protein-like [Polyodon spathula]|uniref:ZP domain-containing protein-like n=1 Tax=Polyodon spathula TaxID=7913 RepID=UPI001B7E5610|nr:ZP domain-containing protein-like [Polyodon spathula]
MIIYALNKKYISKCISVDPAVPSCNFGEYRPQFLNPSPPHGIYVNASVGHEFQIPLRAAATRDRIYDIKISGPLNITKTLKNYNNSRGVIDVMITWTPTENDFGEHIPICFIAETASGYQSKMRCIIVVVVNESEADIECTDTTMTLYISKSSVRGLHENHLRLNDPTCSVTSNGSHIIASVSLNSCGTKLEETEHDLIFRNEITSFENPHDIITRKHQIEIPFICKFPKKSRLSASFKAHKSAYLFTEAGFGSFTYLFEFYDSSAFSRMINPNSYPIEVQLQDMIYMDIQVQTSLSTTQLFVESCRATSNDNPSDPIYYDIISNGCIEDETTVVYLNNQTDFRFGLEAFNFIGNYEQVYISCTVILCVAGDPSNRCAQGCTNGTSIGHHHRKRSLASQSQRHFISQGPLRFARSSSGSPGSNLNLNLNILVVAVAFIAAIFLVCGVLIYKAKMANIVKYETVPSADF